MSVDMWVGLDKLLELQNMDLAIRKLESEVSAIPQAIVTIDQRLAKARQDLDTAKSSVDQLQKQRRGKERELEEVTQNTKKKQARLFEIKTNEEYSAVLKEIEVLKAKSSTLETEILEQMEAGDQTAKIVSDAERVFQAEQTACQQGRQEKESRLAVLQRELSELTATRKGQASRLDRDLLRQYTRLMQNRDTAVVPVTDGTCQGCGMALTPQTYAEVRRNDRMFACPSCNRILYFPG